MARTRLALKPRKQPIQARSTHTVAQIFEACIQVLLATGLEGLTTTRVAERAGVSVGTLYQYFPNKQALLAAVLEQHLQRVVEAVERACVEARGRPTAAMAQAVVGAFIDAKMADPAASRALYAVAAELDGAAIVARLTLRSQVALVELLATAPDRHFDALPLVGYTLSTAVVGPVQGLLVSQAGTAAVDAVREQLVAMASAYLAAVGTRRARVSRA